MGDELRNILITEKRHQIYVDDEETNKQHELIGPVVFFRADGTRYFCGCAGCNLAYNNTGE